jgi:hypothetical protein
MEKLNILVLHCLGNPELAPRSLDAHVHALRLHSPEHRYLYHDAHLPLPDYVKETSFHAIILDVTFLTARWAAGDLLQRRQEEYAFVKDSDAVKIALPQDEYDCNELLDQWMLDWNIDVVFSVISSHHNVLYPRYHLQGVIRVGYTAYLDDSLLKQVSKPFQARRIDIGYRARKLPPYFGHLGNNKSVIGETVKNLATQTSLKTDILLGQKGELLGQRWLDFISDSKFTLGANSGSSMLDPVGDIQKQVRSYLQQYPDAEFDEVEQKCFPGIDGFYQFTAISPRVIEAAMLRSCQILVEGEYSNIIKPWVHYMPLKADASNFDEILRAMRDHALVSSMIHACRETIINTPQLRQKHNTESMIQTIIDGLNSRHVVTDHEKVERCIKRYQTEMVHQYQRVWRLQKLRFMAKSALSKHPRLFILAKAIERSKTFFART